MKTTRSGRTTICPNCHETLILLPGKEHPCHKLNHLLGIKKVAGVQIIMPLTKITYHKGHTYYQREKTI